MASLAKPSRLHPKNHKSRPTPVGNEGKCVFSLFSDCFVCSFCSHHDHSRISLGYSEVSCAGGCCVSHLCCPFCTLSRSVFCSFACFLLSYYHCSVSIFASSLTLSLIISNLFLHCFFMLLLLLFWFIVVLFCVGHRHLFCFYDYCCHG